MLVVNNFLVSKWTFLPLTLVKERKKLHTQCDEPRVRKVTVTETEKNEKKQRRTRINKEEQEETKKNKSYEASEGGCAGAGD
jgi:hypothetical protein